MITIIYSTHKDKQYNESFRNDIIKTSGLNDIQILEYINNDMYSLASIYNNGVNNSNFDIVVCVHNDIKLENGWGKKLLKDFENNPDYGIIGKAGSCYFPRSGVYWERMNETMVGQVYHEPEGHKKYLTKFSPKFNFLIPVVTIDGLFIAFNKNKIKYGFDESIGKFHFYDHTFCLSNVLNGVKIGVTSSFEITHKSIGATNEEFNVTKNQFLGKYGKYLPITLKPNEVYVDKIKEKPIKNIGKVAVIIPTKSKLDLLFDCIDSYIEHCNPNLFEIFVADTGSDDSEIQQIEGYISKNSDKVKINLIQYDYYNFSKINNDVVKNHVGDDFEFLLFSNNDIKLLNNVIYGMLKVFKTQNKVGTVGPRMHFADNTIQHNGILALLDKNKKIYLTHLNLNSYYNYSKNLKQVIGNTAGLMMIRKNVFENNNYFNESYVECFEDVELNIKCLLNGYVNYNDGSLVAYHYESQSRNEDKDKNERVEYDYINFLYPYMYENLNKLLNIKLTT